MTRGRKITLHLVDGSANGIIKGQIGNWVGQVTSGKITQLLEFASDVDAKRPGIYVLSGPDLEGLYNQSVYIGESENVWERIKQHDRDETKSHFEKVAVISSRDESLTKGHILYLESRLIEIALSNQRANVANSQQPKPSALPLADQDELEVFLEHLELLLPVLGLNFILPAPVTMREAIHMPKDESPIDSPIFEIETTHRDSGISVKARAQIVDGEFVVMQGSTALQRNEGTYASQKDKLIRSERLKWQDEQYVFTIDVPFDSPSAAAAVVRGQNTNGPKTWRLASGESYAEWQERRIDEKERAQ